VVGDSKILTVSYGTFSCTLEGFDDPFSTMKAIAEYFRDLAAGDRYFGAEPPQPDTDMLQRIAEETNRSRIDAEVSENALVLRQAEADTAPQTRATPIAAAAAMSAMVQEDTAPESDAKASEPEAQDMAYEAVSDAEEDGLLEEAEELETAEDLTEAASEVAHDPAEAISEHAGYGQRDSIAEKLQRIRAVVSRENATSDEDEAAFFSEDQHADEFDASAPEAETYEADYGTSFEEEADQETASDGGSMLASVMARAADDKPEQSAAATQDDPATDEDDSVLSDALAALSAEEDASDAEPDFEPEIDVEAELASEATALAEAQIEDDVAIEDEAADMAPEPVTTERQPIKVEKITRSDIEAAQAGNTGLHSPEDASADDSELSAEAEAALMNELAQVEAEMQAASEGDPISATDEQSHRDEELDAAQRAARKERALQVEDEDDALNRLMDATSSRMSDDDEGAVRRASIAHLKAAVAATKADDSIAQAAADEDEREMDQYRSDLARVVRPGRAQPRSQQAETQRPSPLVLVSEQRIDGDEETAPAAAAELQPRRVNAGNLALEEEFEEEMDQNPFAASDQESFRAFAARHAAVELPDLLEAAAAHYAYVEQKDDFTRPMLMNKTTSINEDGTITREEGLRAFGSLLRRGRIVKRGNGKFVISEKSQFAPEAREAGE